MVQQVAFYIPPDIAVGLAAGEYVQYGGVIRDTLGRIVKHLEPVDIDNDVNAALETASQTAELSDQNKQPGTIVATVLAVVTAVIGIVACILHFRKKKRMEMDEERNLAMGTFNAAFTDYLRSLNDGCISIEIIDKLEQALATLQGENQNLVLEIEGNQFKELVRSIRDYTERFAVANGETKQSAILELPERKPDDVRDLRECLAQQRKILEKAA